MAVSDAYAVGNTAPTSDAYAIGRGYDLLSALDSGILAGVGLDVLPVEPVADARLLGHPKVILTPHAAFFSVQSEIELRRKAAQNIVTWINTGRPEYVVVEGTRRLVR